MLKNEQTHNISPAISLDCSAFDPDIVGSFSGFKDIKSNLEELENNPNEDQEKLFHPQERQFIIDNEDSIITQALPVSNFLKAAIDSARENWNALHHFHFSPTASRKEALFLRYICVPLAYRLGYYTLAPKIAEMTFKILLPDIEKSLSSAVKSKIQHSSYSLTPLPS